MASAPNREPLANVAPAPHRHAAPLAKQGGPMKAKKNPAIKRSPSRDRSTDLELPQLG